MLCFRPLLKAKMGTPSNSIYFRQSTPIRGEDNRVEECSHRSVHPSQRRGASPQVLRTESRIESQRRIRRRRNLRVWQGFMGLHLPVSGSGHVESQYGILGGGRRGGGSPRT